MVSVARGHLFHNFELYVHAEGISMNGITKVIRYYLSSLLPMCIDIPQAACDMPEPKSRNVPPPTPLGEDEWNSTTRAPVRR